MSNEERDSVPPLSLGIQNGGQGGESPGPDRRQIRPFTPADEADVIGVWHRAGLAAYTYIPTWQELTLEMAGDVFREHVLSRCDIWVGTLDGVIVAYLAMSGPFIDRMYVDPPEWRKGWGTRLLQLAMQRHPEGLRLFTHQENHAARGLYEKHGFKAVKFGVSPPPENAPDVEYEWRGG